MQGLKTKGRGPLYVVMGFPFAIAPELLRPAIPTIFFTLHLFGNFLWNLSDTSPCYDIATIIFRLEGRRESSKEFGVCAIYCALEEQALYRNIMLAGNM